MLKHSPVRKSTQGGFLLIEVLVSLLLFSIGLLAMLGMQTYAINDTMHGKYRTDAGYLANSIVGRMMVDKANVASYVNTSYTARSAWDSEVAAALPNATTSITLLTDGSYTVVIRWKNPNETGFHKYEAQAQVVF
jgi:type IV pilus assembly protein PilV